jgi:nucleoside 2-deoxyribosyltransferase
MYDIYWANSLFSQSDRDFNRCCAHEIRSIGLTVFLPQELMINKSNAPTEKEIFENDTKAINESRIIIACIDQETIDCGVACEIGIAYSLGKYIIGLYTDIRKDRLKYKMYKNPYVIGAILSNGLMVKSLNELIIELLRYFEKNNS